MPFPQWYQKLLSVLEEAPKNSRYAIAVLDGDDIAITYKVCCRTCADAMCRELVVEMMEDEKIPDRPEIEHDSDPIMPAMPAITQ